MFIFIPDQVYLLFTIQANSPVWHNVQKFLVGIIPKGYRYIMKLKEFVKRQRKINGLTQTELARKAGVGLRFVRDLEQGKATLRMDKVNQVLQLFGKTLGPVDWHPEIGED